jgi:hypothetical protein
MDGADHVSSAQIVIRRLGELDRETGRLPARHVLRSNGQESSALDRGPEVQECSKEIIYFYYRKYSLPPRSNL